MNDELYHALLRNVKAYVLLIARDFTVVYTNYYDLCGDTAPDHPQRVGDLLHCDNALCADKGCGTHDLCRFCSVRNTIEAAFRDRENFYHVEAPLKLRQRSGGVIRCHAELSGERMLLDGREYMVITVHDITHLKHVENELQQARRQAEEANHSKLVFLSNMGHEIRTPLNAIVGFCQLLADADQPEVRSQCLEVIQSNCRLMQQLVSDILDLSKIEAGMLEFNLTDTDLRQLILDQQQIFTLRFSEQGLPLTLRTRMPELSHTLHTDPIRLAQVLANFLTNAGKFTAQGSVTLGYEPLAEGVRLFVSDTGCGIPREQQARIFDRFVRLDASKAGTGLGLAICRMIVERLGGRIGVESEVGRGSTFWVFLPWEA